MESDSLYGNIEDEHRSCWDGFKSWIYKHLLLIMTFFGVLFGFIIGFAIRPLEPSQTAILWLGMPGELFLRMLKLMILPLIVSSVISGTASLDPKINGKISLVSFVYIVATNVLGSVIAVVLAVILKPGVGIEGTQKNVTTDVFETQDIFADLLRNLVPDNMVEAAFVQAQTQNEERLSIIEEVSSNGTVNRTVRSFKKTAGKTSGTNLLGIITTSMVIGIAAGMAKEQGRPVLNFFASMADIFIRVLRLIFWVTPIGIGSLILVAIAEINDMRIMFEQLGLFVAVVTIGICLHQIVFMPALLFFLTRRNPFKFYLHIGKAWMIAFATTSTAVAIPEMLSACEEDQKVDKRVSRFVIPFCVTLNADGSALFITAAAIFIGNLTGMAPGAGDITLICLLTSVTSMALPSVPSSSIVSLVMILTSMNIPIEGISLLFAVEWFLDRIRTTSNVVSHTFGTLITYQCCKTYLKETSENLTEEEITMVNINELTPLHIKKN